MRIYVFYDSKTGKIVHEHMESSDVAARSDADLLKLAHPSHKPSSLRVLRIDERLQAGGNYRVNPRTGKLQQIRARVPRSRAFMQSAASTRK
jgi:hypothetical protein